MSNNTNIYFNLSSATNTTTIGSSVVIKGQNTVNFILSGISERYYNVLFIDINWGDGTPITTIRKKAVYDYKNQSIFYEIINGKPGGTVCTTYSHDYINTSISYGLDVTAKFTLTYDNGSVAYFEQPIRIYHGSFYDDTVELVAINTQIQPLSSNNTFINFESKYNVQTIPSILATTGSTIS